jgi:hypothetical protein
MSTTTGIISLIVGAVTLRPGPGSFFDISLDQAVLLLSVSVLLGILAITIGYLSKFKVVVIMVGVNLAFFTCIFLGSFFQFGEALGRKVSCPLNMQIISNAIQMYCQENEGVLPDADAWCDQLLDLAEIVEGVSIGRITIRRNASNQDENLIELSFNKNLDEFKISDIDRQTVLLFETDLGWNQNGTLAILASKGHLGFWPFCEGGYHFLLVGPGSTFTVKFIKNSELESLNWTPAE